MPDILKYYEGLYDKVFKKPQIKTGLEQELNARVSLKGDIALPEMKPLMRRMAADSIVLLKNDGILPLKKEETVAVFGRCAINYFVVGYGSGGDVIPPYKANLMDGLRDRNVKIYEPLAESYRVWCASRRNQPIPIWDFGQWPLSYPEMPLVSARVKEAAKNSDTALVVIGRAAGESRECELAEGSYYLTERENRMMELVTKYFDRVCVIMDCGNVVDMGWTEKFGDKIGAIVYAWHGGMESGYALADVLTGEVNPSGRLADTLARFYEDYPSSDDFGGDDFNNYSEDVYVGYRYFETFSPDTVMWPFGYGLSYTDFDIKTAASVDGDCVKIEAVVTNTGCAAGREVVQVYLGLPDGKMGNPVKVLAAFGKTRELACGESETITFNVELSELAPYDDAGVTGNRSCRVLEAGEYKVYVGKNVRDAELCLSFVRDEDKIVSRLSENLAPKEPFKRITRRGGELVYEDTPKVTKNLREEILANLPKTIPYTGNKGIVFEDVVSGKNTVEEFVAQLSAQELDDIAHGEGEMNSSFGIRNNAGMFGGATEKLRSRGIPPIITTDGPAGVRIMDICALLPSGAALACTFDTVGVQALYAMVSQELREKRSDMLLGPGLNIHRNPLCGRNFEYFSEDPLLTGKMAAAAIRGIQATGVSACPKHFACNDQEHRRNFHDARVSERALRDIYLRGFEIAVKESDPMCLMTSYNKINGVYSHYNYELVTGVLRREWGYKGLVITDWWMQPGESPEFPGVTNDAYRVRGGIDVLMPGSFENRADPGRYTIVASMQDSDGITVGEAQAVAVRVIELALRLAKEKE